MAPPSLLGNSKPIPFVPLMCNQTMSTGAPCAQNFLSFIHLLSNSEGILSPILPPRKLRLREVQSPAQGHTARNRKRWDQSPSPSDSSVYALSTQACSVVCQLCSEVQRQETGPALETCGVGGKADRVPWEQRATQARLAGRLQKGVTLHPLGRAGLGKGWEKPEKVRP